MAILIDGYNLLHATGYIAAGEAYDSLEGPRRNFLQFLVERLTRSEAGETTVVFDAAKAPPGLPTEVSFGCIRVLFAHNHAEADDLIEELIQSNNVPQKLTVVSSDHRIHRAARRRRATVVDSDQWYWELHDRPTVEENTEVDAGRDITLNDDEVAGWVELFGDVDTTGLERGKADESTEAKPSIDASAADAPQSAATAKKDVPTESPFPTGYGDDVVKDLAKGEDIFPPGYGEDLLEEDLLEDDLLEDKEQ